MALSFRYAAHSEIGLVRKTNQDSGYVSPTMLMVADGMGGAAAGDLASSVAIDHLRTSDEGLTRLLTEAEKRVAIQAREHDAADEARLATDPDDTAPEGTGDLGTREAALLGVLGATLTQANQHIADLVADDSALEGMGTTVCGFALVEGTLAVINIGDSRAYLLRDGQLRRVTRDHSWVQTLVDEGRITEAQALEHPHRSLVLRVLNGNPQHQPDLGILDVRPGDRLLVCSDGLCGLVTDQQIARLLGEEDRDRTLDSLVDLAHEAGGYDNITIIIADMVDGPPDGETAVIGAARNISIPATPEHTAALPPVEKSGATDAAAAGDDAGRVQRDDEEERYALAGRRGLAGWARMLLVVLIPLLVLGGGAWGWYSYTQTQYYVGPDDDVVAVYRGVPDRVLNFDLSSIVRSDTTRIGDLPPYYAERVRGNIKVENLAAADTTIDMLRQKAAKCVAQREARARARTAPPVTPSPTPTPTPTVPTVPTGTASPDATPSPALTPSPTPTPTQTQVTTPEDC